MNSDTSVKSIKEKDKDSDSLYLEEKIANLPPSKDILNFYRSQIKSLEEDNIAICKKLEQYKTFCDDYHNALTTINKHEYEIHHLQRSLSELQDCLFQEKESTAKLKTQLLDTKTDKSSFVEQPKENVFSRHHHKLNSDWDFDINENFVKRSTCDHFRSENEDLKTKVELLRRQLIDQSVSSKERFESMMAAQKERMKQTEEGMKEDKEKIDLLTNKLYRAQDMLYESTKELLDLRDARREDETRWMEEKEKSTNEMKLAKDKAVNALKKSLQVVERKLKDSENKNELLIERSQILEEELTNSKEEFDAVNIELQSKLEQTTNLLSVLNKRHKDLEVRKRLEVEGYKTEINFNKIKLQNTEDQFYKVAMAYSKDLGLFDGEDDDGDDDGDDDDGDDDGDDDDGDDDDGPHKTNEGRNKYKGVNVKRKVFSSCLRSPANRGTIKSHANVLKKRNL